MTTSSVYVHLQRPDNGEWITVGRYTLERTDGGQNGLALGSFKYAPSYLGAGYPWVIDPVNLGVLDLVPYPAPRYNGLTDVLRDISPDSWGKFLVQKERGLSAQAHEFEYLVHSGNVDRWGALAISSSKKPSASNIASPKMPKLADMIEELQLMSSQKPPKHPEIRKRLMKTLSSGGARPKATVQNGEVFWIVKPTISSDTSNVALLENVCMRMGSRAKLNMAETYVHQDDARTAVLVKRFDRTGSQRHMVLSGASLLKAEYPAKNGFEKNNVNWSYPTLARTLREIGVPDVDLVELFGRMIFNALIGNDDDHPRNHAVVWSQSQKKWRLSPAFDVVPNMLETPITLSMQLSQDRWDISREALFADWKYFGFIERTQAQEYANNLMAETMSASQFLEDDGLSTEDSELIRARIQAVMLKLK
jgi:serine/threonine-protein kinase HipA